jgi:hypothetical protein
MALTLQVGQTGTLLFTPQTVGIDPARITKEKWKVLSGPVAVAFTLPNQIEGMAPGTNSFIVTVTLSPLETGAPIEEPSWPFDITCVAPGLTPPPPVVPVLIDNLITPPPAP